MHNLIVDPYTPAQINHMITHATRALKVPSITVTIGVCVLVTLVLLTIGYTLYTIKPQSYLAIIGGALLMGANVIIISNVMDQHNDMARRLQTTVNRKTIAANQLSNQLQRNTYVPKNTTIHVNGFTYHPTIDPNNPYYLGKKLDQQNSTNNQTSSEGPLIPLNPVSKHLGVGDYPLYDSTATKHDLELNYTTTNHQRLTLNKQGTVASNNTSSKLLLYTLTLIHTYASQHAHDQIVANVAYKPAHKLAPEQMVARLDIDKSKSVSYSTQNIAAKSNFKTTVHYTK